MFYLVAVYGDINKWGAHNHVILEGPEVSGGDFKQIAEEVRLSTEAQTPESEPLNRDLFLLTFSERGFKEVRRIEFYDAVVNLDNLTEAERGLMERIG